MENSQTILETKEPTLKYLYSLFYKAHSFTSFSPDRRADSYVKEYSLMLDSDLLLLGDNQGNYKEKFISKLSDWMNAKGRCISSMITGPSNFPVRRAQKANNSERNKCDAFYTWREKYFIAVNRVPTKTPEDDQELAETKYEQLSLNQLEYKEINKAIKKAKIEGLNETMNFLLSEGFSPESVKRIDNYYGSQSGKYLIPPYVLSNNNAKLKAAKTKITVMRNRIECKNSWEDIIFEGGKVTIEDDRLKIYHDNKPEIEIIQEIKSNGYRWSPHWKCWCRKHTGNAIYNLRFLSFIN